MQGMDLTVHQASAVQTKAWYRPNGWFTDREVKIVVNRVLRDDPSKGALAVRNCRYYLTDLSRRYAQSYGDNA